MPLSRVVLPRVGAPAHPFAGSSLPPCPGRCSGLQWRCSLDLNSQRLDLMVPREER